MLNLSNCPFCGEEAFVLQKDINFKLLGCVRYSDCPGYAMTHKLICGDELDKHIAAWNRRCNDVSCKKVKNAGIEYKDAFGRKWEDETIEFSVGGGRVHMAMQWKECPDPCCQVKVMLESNDRDKLISIFNYPHIKVAGEYLKSDWGYTSYAKYSGRTFRQMDVHFNYLPLNEAKIKAREFMSDTRKLLNSLDHKKFNYYFD